MFLQPQLRPAEPLAAPKEWRAAAVSAAFPSLIVTPCGGANLASRVSRAATAEAALEAAAAALRLKHGGRDNLESVLLLSAPKAARFDLGVTVSFDAAAAAAPGGRTPGKKGAAAAAASADASPLGGRAATPAGTLVGCSDQVTARAVEDAAEAAMSQALGNRALLVRSIRRRLPPGWMAGGASSDAGSADGACGEWAPLWLGAILDTAEAPRLVDVGPPAEDKAASQAFRAFWGDKSELRRFQDGVIAESVVWDRTPRNMCVVFSFLASLASSYEAHLFRKSPLLRRILMSVLPPRASAHHCRRRHTIPAQAAEAALRRHLPCVSAVASSLGALDGALRPRQPASASDGGAGAGSGAEAAWVPGDSGTMGPALHASLDRLGERIRGLESVPLKVVSVAPVSAAFRSMAPFPPEPHPLCGGDLSALAAGAPACVEPLEILVQLEGSGRWPSDKAAFEKTRAAFAIAIAKELGSAFGTHCSASEEAVDVFFEGFAFRMRVTTESELRQQQAALRGAPQLGAPGSGAPTDSEKRTAAAARAAEAMAAAAAAHRFDSQPLAARAALAGASAGAGALHAALPHTVRLAKRWVAAHMFSPHLSGEAVELICGERKTQFQHPYFFGSSLLPFYPTARPRSPCWRRLLPHRINEYSIIIKSLTRCSSSAGAIFGAPPGGRRAPASRETGFLLFLQTLASHPWGSTPLVVDWDGSLTAGAITLSVVSRCWFCRIAGAASLLGRDEALCFLCVTEARQPSIFLS